MNTSGLITVLLLFGLLAAACSSGTKTESSWSNLAFDQPVKNIYLIGIARTDFNRNYFENTVHGKLRDMGVNSIPSSTDLPRMPQKPEIIKDKIIRKMKENDCDSVLVAKVIHQDRKATFQTQRGSYNYSQGPRYTGSRVFDDSALRRSEYSDWATYYSMGTKMVYSQPGSKSVLILTIEAALYDLESEELIWTAQFETGREEDFEAMVKKFVDEMTGDLRKNGNI